MTDFSDYPKSINEIKAKNAVGGSDIWTPRDCLISALRDIDSGELNPASMVIVMAIETEERTHIESYQAIPNSFYGAGILQGAILNLLTPR